MTILKIGGRQTVRVGADGLTEARFDALAAFNERAGHRYFGIGHGSAEGAAPGLREKSSSTRSPLVDLYDLGVDALITPVRPLRRRFAFARGFLYTHNFCGIAEKIAACRKLLPNLTSALCIRIAFSRFSAPRL